MQGGWAGRLPGPGLRANERARLGSSGTGGQDAPKADHSDFPFPSAPEVRREMAVPGLMPGSGARVRPIV